MNFDDNARLILLKAALFCKAMFGHRLCT